MKREIPRKGREPVSVYVTDFWVSGP